MLSVSTWAVSFSCTAARASPRMHLNSASTRLHPRSPVSTSLRSPVRSLLRRRLLLNDVRPPRLTCVAVYRLVLKTARHHCLVLCDASTSAECFEASPTPLPRASCAGCWLLAAGSIKHVTVSNSLDFNANFSFRIFTR